MNSTRAAFPPHFPHLAPPRPKTSLFGIGRSTSRPPISSSRRGLVTGSRASAGRRLRKASAPQWTPSPPAFGATAPGYLLTFDDIPFSTLEELPLPHLARAAHRVPAGATEAAHRKATRAKPEESSAEMRRKHPNARLPTESGWTRRERRDYVGRTMIDPPHKSGWYWILRAQLSAMPEVAFWTGESFLTISGVLQLEDVAICDEEPLRPPVSMTS
jgi:hypothetical protein